MSPWSGRKNRESYAEAQVWWENFGFIMMCTLGKLCSQSSLNDTQGLLVIFKLFLNYGCNTMAYHIFIKYVKNNTEFLSVRLCVLPVDSSSFCFCLAFSNCKICAEFLVLEVAEKLSKNRNVFQSLWCFLSPANVWPWRRFLTEPASWSIRDIQEQCLLRGQMDIEPKSHSIN